MECAEYDNMNDKIDNTFMARRRAQIFLELHKEDPMHAVAWLLSNVPVQERTEITKYFNDEDEYQDGPKPTTD